MNRHLARTLAMQTLYEWDFQPEKSSDTLLRLNLESVDHADGDTTFLVQLVHQTIKNVKKIDDLIMSAAPEWPIDQISVVDKSILRLAIAELVIINEVPPKVVINEAVELSKTFGGDTTSKFVNGVLGTVYRQSDRFVAQKE